MNNHDHVPTLLGQTTKQGLKRKATIVCYWAPVHYWDTDSR